MQTVQQCAQFDECRRYRCAHSDVRGLGSVGDPRRKPTHGPIWQLAENVLSMWKLHSSLNAKALSKQRMELIVNLDDLGSMGIMFLARAVPAKPT